MLTHSPYAILIVLIITMALFIWGYWRYDIVALIALAVSVAIGAVPMHKVYSGLDNPAVITVACVMIISQAITRSGAINFLVRHISQISKQPTLLVGSLSTVSAVLSAFMNNVGALGLMMPVTIETAAKAKRSASMFLMPIALASALGGLVTMIGTPPNLLIASFRQKVLGQPFSMFDFSYVGLPIAVIGIIYLALLGWRLIPGSRKAPKSAMEAFQVKDYTAEVQVTEKSPLVGRPVRSLSKITDVNFTLIGLIRNKRKKLILEPHQLFAVDDILIIQANPQSLRTILETAQLKMLNNESLSTDTLQSEDVALIEAVVAPGARIENRSSSSIRLGARYRINLLALAREGNPFKERLHNVNLRAGDVALIQGPANSLNENATNLGFLPLVERGIQVGNGQRKWQPLIFFILAVIVAATRLVPVQVAFGGALLLMILTRCIPARLIYDSIDWPVIILLAAMIPIGEALQTTGGTALIAHSIIQLASQISPIYILALILLITMTLSDFMNNAATAVVMTPIAASIAQALHANPDCFLMAVAIGASCSFLTPVGHQNNTLVMGPGGYKFTDYIRVGLVLEIVILLMAIPLLTWFWPLYPASAS